MCMNIESGYDGQEWRMESQSPLEVASVDIRGDSFGMRTSEVTVSSVKASRTLAPVSLRMAVDGHCPSVEVEEL